METGTVLSPDSIVMLSILTEVLTSPSLLTKRAIKLAVVPGSTSVRLTLTVSPSRVTPGAIWAASPSVKLKNAV